MRSVSVAHAAAVAQPATRPGYLVRVDFSTSIFISSRGDVAWDGRLWVAAKLKVSGISQNAKGRATAKLDFGNFDLTWSALVLNEGVADRRVRIWTFDAGATAAEDFVPIFDGVGDSADISEDRVTMSLVTDSTRTASSPRRFIGPMTGFNHLSPAGKRISIGQDVIVLERR